MQVLPWVPFKIENTELLISEDWKYFIISESKHNTPELYIINWNQEPQEIKMPKKIKINSQWAITILNKYSIKISNWTLNSRILQIKKI